MLLGARHLPPGVVRRPPGKRDPVLLAIGDDANDEEDCLPVSGFCTEAVLKIKINASDQIEVNQLKNKY